MNNIETLSFHNELEGLDWFRKNNPQVYMEQLD